MFQLETDRLIIREWRDEDIVPFSSMNSDLEVMRYFVKPMTFEQSVLMVEKMRSVFESKGYSFYCVEERISGLFVGLTGIAPVLLDVDFSPATEIGWRISRQFWGRGYAPEAANAVLNYARDVVQLEEVVSFTSENNLNSQRVMEKIGMLYDPDGDFMHPNVSAGNALSKHVLYRLSF